MFGPGSSSARIDAIVFLRPNLSVGFAYGPDGRMLDSPDIGPWEAPWCDAEIAQKIRNLPETCAMRDGRKWKRIPQIVLTDHGFRHQAYDGLDVEFIFDVTDLMLHNGYASPVTWDRIEKAINLYHEKTLKEYERVGFLVIADHGRYRIKRAFRKKNAHESEFYLGSKDKRRLHEYVTIGRNSEGVNYEAFLFEHLLNDHKTGEREIHNFLEQHPDLLADAMMGVPISHQPYFPSNNQNPDFVISRALPRSHGDWAKLLELKGPDANILANRRHLHRGLSPAIIQALAQVNDYNESFRDPLNLRAVEKALGYTPEFSERAVLIGRNPSAQDAELWKKRKAEQVSVKIVTYDEILEQQQTRHAWRKNHHI
ncbi:MAG: Shedu anti-phage system protein SduA domain-containing protein [Edaphobacter sp.]